MKVSKYILLLFFFAAQCKATDQILETVSIGVGGFAFYQDPLTQLISHDEFNKLYDTGPGCSAAWRGYKGYWRILQKQLYLTYLERDPCGFEVDPKDWKAKSFDFGKIKKGLNYHLEPILADWYTGEIVIPIDESKYIEGKYDENGANLFEFEAIIYKIEKGKVTSRNIEIRNER